MFDRSRYNWAATQVETSCKFDFAATDEEVDVIKSFLAQDALFEMTNARRKRDGLNWYHALAAVMRSLKNNGGEVELQVAQLQLYALIFAACATKAGVTASSSFLEVLADSYEVFGLDRSEMDEIEKYV